MNFWIRLGWRLSAFARRIRPHYDESGPLAWARRKMSEASYWVERKARHRGEKKFLYCKSVNSAGMEIRRHLFRKLRVYVEGYLADTAYRRFEHAPDPMPADEGLRKSYGWASLQKMGIENDPGYLELARIYEWLVYDWPKWENPYWNRAPDPEPGKGHPLEIPDDKKEDWEKYTTKARRLDRIMMERTKHRAEQLFKHRHLLQYD